LQVLKPLLLTGLIASVNVDCSTRGGGNTGQAGACRLAISRAIADLHPEKRAILKKATFMKRDPRMVERKKPGQKKARKKFQWVKR
jgi:small subunit ribosomal protein S9